MASKRHIRKRSCESKRKYDNVQDALKTALRLGKDPANNGINVHYNVYKCKFCNKLHIGRSPKGHKTYVDKKKNKKFRFE